MHGADLPWYYNSLILPAPATRILKGKIRARNAKGAAEAHPSLSPPAQPEVRHEAAHTQGIQLLHTESRRSFGSPAACVVGAGRRSAPRTHPITGRFIGTSSFFFFLCCFFYAFAAGSCSHTVVCPSLSTLCLLSDGKMAAWCSWGVFCWYQPILLVCVNLHVTPKLIYFRCFSAEIDSVLFFSTKCGFIIYWQNHEYHNSDLFLNFHDGILLFLFLAQSCTWLATSHPLWAIPL